MLAQSCDQLDGASCGKDKTGAATVLAIAAGGADESVESSLAFAAGDAARGVRTDAAGMQCAIRRVGGDGVEGAGFQGGNRAAAQVALQCGQTIASVKSGIARDQF